MFKTTYKETEHISIIYLIVIKIGYMIEKIAHTLIKPCYAVNQYDMVMEIDDKTKTLQRVYPDALLTRIEIPDTFRYRESCKELFYIKQSAIDFFEKHCKKEAK